MNQLEVFTTTDYFEGAYLLTKGNELKGVRLLPGKENKAVFQFEGEHAEFDAYFYNTHRGNADALDLRDAYFHLQEEYRKAVEKNEARKSMKKSGRRVYA